MKRLIAILLSCLSMFCACVINNVPKIDNSDSVSEESSQSEILPPTEVLTEILVSEEKKNTVVSDGATYTTNVAADEKYADTYNIELADALIDTSVTSFFHNSLSGYATRSLTVVMDLGDYYRNIHTFQAFAYLTDTAGISSQLTINAYCSLDGEEWERVGTLFQDQNGSTALGTVNTYQLNLKKYVNAHYVKFIITGNNGWIFLQEFSVIADTDDKVQALYANGVNDAYANYGTLSAPKDGSAVDYSLPKVNIAKEKRYTIDTPRNKDYIDVDGKMLTDGIATGYIADKNWVGFNGGNDITVVVDLGKTVSDVQSVEASFYTNINLKNYLPAAVSFAALDKDKNPTDLGIVYGSKTIKNGNYKFTLAFEKCVTARYIQLVFHTVPDSLVLIEEISVYSYRESYEDYLYPPVTIAQGGSEKPNPDGKYKNLLLSRPQQIDTSVNLSDFYEENNSPVTNKTLTDGVFSTDYNIHNGKFFKFYVGESRNIIYDLEYLCAVDKFTASFCHEEDWGMYAPSEVNVYISDDGDSWYEIGSMAPNESSIEGVYKYNMVLDTPVIARHIAFSFETALWVGCDELEAFGTETISNGDHAEDLGLKSAHSATATNKRKEPSQDLLGGARQLSLLYHSPDNSGYTVSDLLPYVGYVNENGEIVDTMFDSFLFLHNTGSMPSGNTPFSGSTLSDWYWTIDDLFTEGENLYALEEAAGQVKSALGLDESYTYKVAMTIYYPTVENCENFGDIDGDGKNDDFKIYENRIRAIRDYIDAIEERFARAGFENIELVGYYWWHEDMTSTPETDIKQLLNEISDYVHTKDKDFFWIPYFTAPGFSDWEEYGFDIACMQPNYVFTGERPYSNLVNNEKFTRYYGMGVEMEIFENCLSDIIYFKRYMQYISVGVQTGYMSDTVNMYYQSYYVFRDAANSRSVMGRMVYDNTYQYIHGTIKFNPDALPAISAAAKLNTPLDHSVDYGSEKLREYEVVAMPEHGTVTFNPNGSFTFYPEHGFTGETSFSFRYSEYLGWSDECVVTITVAEAL